MQSTICASSCDKGKAVFPIASWGCTGETEKRLVKNVEILDQRVELDQVRMNRTKLAPRRKARQVRGGHVFLCVRGVLAR